MEGNYSQTGARIRARPLSTEDEAELIVNTIAPCLRRAPRG